MYGICFPSKRCPRKLLLETFALQPQESPMAELFVAISSNPIQCFKSWRIHGQDFLHIFLLISFLLPSTTTTRKLHAEARHCCFRLQYLACHAIPEDHLKNTPRRLWTVSFSCFSSHLLDFTPGIIRKSAVPCTCL